jgi:molecular chaperone GrpE (heat shock protein)
VGTDANWPAPLCTGLTSDDQNLYNDRIKLWNDFNHAWLSLLQMQKELMESGQQLQRSQTLISREGLEKMAKELLRLCDQIERHGLVDYQYGVWEEQIIAGMSLISLSSWFLRALALTDVVASL